MNMEFMQLIFNGLIATATIGGAITALCALKTWKKQKLSALAEEMIATAHSLHKIIAESRRRVPLAHEHARHPTYKDSDGLEQNGSVFVQTLERINQYQPELALANYTRLKGKLHFTQSAVDELDSLTQTLAGIKNAAISCEEILRNNGDPHKRAPELLQRALAPIDGADSVQIEALAHVQKIEELLKRYL